LLLSSPALADETWVTAGGPAIYEADIGPTGIVSVVMGKGRAHFYFDGPGGNSTERFVMTGRTVTMDNCGFDGDWSLRADLQ
jgi:hypothetical protein